MGICLAGRATVRAEETTGKLVLSDEWSRPASFTFEEEWITDIIIKKKDGTQLIIPFSDIVDALST